MDINEELLVIYLNKIMNIQSLRNLIPHGKDKDILIKALQKADIARKEAHDEILAYHDKTREDKVFELELAKLTEELLEKLK